jgi:hypothetical protein
MALQALQYIDPTLNLTDQGKRRLNQQRQCWDQRMEAL